MKRFKTTITLTEKQIQSLNSVFQWLIPHRDEFVCAEYRAGILQIEKKLDKASEEIDILKRVDKRNKYMENGGNAFLSKVIMEARKKE